MVQIGVYKQKTKKAKNDSNFEFVPTPPPDTSDPLYAGIQDYLEEHPHKVANYLASHPEFVFDGAEKSPTFFRDLFKALMDDININGEFYQGSPDLIKTNPKKAAIKMQDFFGEEGTELYKLALEEELNSFEYMQAVYHASTDHYTGEKWEERPIVFVSGPSGSGKTYGADEAIKKSIPFLKHDDDNDTGNDVIAVDGGKGREVSQIRKLAIKAANNRGFPGIADLHSQSHILEEVKKRIYEHSILTDMGIVIPETFSHFFIPGDKSKQMLIDAVNMPNSRVIFARVQGKDPDNFQDVVAYMGSSRAWKIDKFGYLKNLDELDEETDCESKAYGPAGYRWGVLGSILAEKWFRQHCKHNLIMAIVNDLVLLKPDPNNPLHYVAAKPNDKGAFKVSERTVKKWADSGRPKPLEEFKDDPENREPSIIYTSAEVKVEVAKAALEKKIDKLKANTEPYQALELIYHELCNTNLKDNQAVSDLMHATDALINQNNIKNGMGLQKLNSLSEALAELLEEKQVVENYEASYIDKMMENMGNLGISITKAVDEDNPKIIENILANPKIRKEIEKEPEIFAILKSSYQSVLDHIADGLHSYQIQLESQEQRETSTENLVNFVVKEILAEDSLKERTMMVERWVALFAKAIERNDTQTAQAIYHGLNEPAVRRLSATFAGLSQNAKAVLASAAFSQRQIHKNAGEQPNGKSIDTTKTTSYLSFESFTKKRERVSNNQKETASLTLEPENKTITPIKTFERSTMQDFIVEKRLISKGKDAVIAPIEEAIQHLDDMLGLIDRMTNKNKLSFTFFHRDAHMLEKAKENYTHKSQKNRR